MVMHRTLTGPSLDGKGYAWLFTIESARVSLAVLQRWHEDWQYALSRSRAQAACAAALPVSAAARGLFAHALAPLTPGLLHDRFC